MDKDKGVVLGSRRQEMLAELCSALRPWWHSIGGEEQPEAVAVANALLLTIKLGDVLDKFDVTPQELDRCYDLLHRTGANR